MSFGLSVAQICKNPSSTFVASKVGAKYHGLFRVTFKWAFTAVAFDMSKDLLHVIRAKGIHINWNQSP